MTTVYVYDEIMGAGKSTRAIERVNNADEDKRYIIVAPFLSECHRYAGTISDPASKDRQKPLRDVKGHVIYTGEGCSKSGRRFYHPENGYRKNKVQHIEHLIKEQKDIVTTHEAMKLFTKDTLDILRMSDYTLIIDEALECISPLDINLTKQRVNMIFGSGYYKVEDETNLLVYTNSDEDEETNTYKKDEDPTKVWDYRLKRLCKNNSVVCLTNDNTGQRNLFMWEYPSAFLKAFDEIEVLTYNFKGTIFEKYLRYFEIDYMILKGSDKPTNIKSLVNLVTVDRMIIPDKEFSLSVSSLSDKTKTNKYAKLVVKKIENFMKNKTYGEPATAKDKMWTTYKKGESLLKGSRYARSFTPYNLIGVNDYRECWKLAYVANVHIHPEIYKYLYKRGEEYLPDRETYALNVLLQWMYRSRLREGKPVDLYVPSERMFNILEKWLEK